MAPKITEPKPSSSSSSSEEESDDEIVEQSDDESYEESDDESEVFKSPPKNKTNPIKPNPPSPKKNLNLIKTNPVQIHKPTSESESESEPEAVIRSCKSKSAKEDLKPKSKQTPETPKIAVLATPSQATTQSKRPNKDIVDVKISKKRKTDKEAYDVLKSVADVNGNKKTTGGLQSAFDKSDDVAKSSADVNVSKKNQTNRPESALSKDKANDDLPGKSIESPKGKLINRFWREADEIAILKGMIEYKSKTGSISNVDMQAIYDIVKKSIDLDFTKGQITEKIRRFKKKFLAYKDESAKGIEKKLLKPHEQECFELCKKIWRDLGNNNVQVPEKIKIKTGKDGMVVQEMDNIEAAQQSARKTSNAVKAVQKADVCKPKQAKILPKADLGDHKFMNKSIKFCEADGPIIATNEGSIIKAGLEFIWDSRSEKFDEKWESLLLAGMKLYMKRCSLIREQNQLMLCKLSE